MIVSLINNPVLSDVGRRYVECFHAFRAVLVWETFLDIELRLSWAAAATDNRYRPRREISFETKRYGSTPLNANSFCGGGAALSLARGFRNMMHAS